jgi:hypothetical protein
MGADDDRKDRLGPIAPFAGRAARGDGAPPPKRNYPELGSSPHWGQYGLHFDIQPLAPYVHPMLILRFLSFL